MIKPKYLKSGDYISIVAPAGKIKKSVVEFAANKLKSWGLNVVLGKNLFNDQFQYSGTDEERLLDFQQALNDESIKAILCARGGYGVIRVIDQLDFSSFRKNPKWVIGFSDITILHSHIHSYLNTETIHGTMAAGLNEEGTSESLRKALFGENLKYELPSHSLSKTGNASGQIVGGNLAILCSLIGSNSDVNTAGKVLFIEDIGEYLYRLDRMMWTLKRAGKLEHLAGLIVGGMTGIKNNDDPFGKTAYEIVAEAIEEYNYPVCFRFPAGHQKVNKTLILGRQISLSVGEKTSLDFNPNIQNPEP